MPGRGGDGGGGGYCTVRRGENCAMPGRDPPSREILFDAGIRSTCKADPPDHPAPLLAPKRDSQDMTRRSSWRPLHVAVEPRTMPWRVAAEAELPPVSGDFLLTPKAGRHGK